MKKLILFLVLCSFTVSAQTSIAPYPVRVKNTATASYDPYQFLYSGDSLKLWYHRTVSGDRFTGTLRARALGKAETNISTGFEMVTPGNDSVLVGAYVYGDGSFRVKGRKYTGSASLDIINANYDTTRIGNKLFVGNATRAGSVNAQEISAVYTSGAVEMNLSTASASNVFLGMYSSSVRKILIGYRTASQFLALDHAEAGASLTQGLLIKEHKIGVGVAAPSAMLHLMAGTATANTAPLKFTSGTLLTSPEVGAVEMNGDSLYFTGTTGTRKALALGGGGSGGGGTAGGWVRTTFIRTDTAGVKVYVAGSLDDTTTYSSLFNVGGTSSFGNDVTFYTDWYYQATKIFENADTSFVNVTFKGNPITTAYIDATLTDKTIDGTSAFTGSGGVNTAGNLATTGVLSVTNVETQGTFAYDASNKFTIAVSDAGVATLTATGGITMALDGANISNVSITADKIANATITGAKIASGTITGTQIQDASIAGADIGSATITGSNIASGTITAGNITDGTITGGDIASGTITGGNIAATTITAGLIGNLEITAAQIANLTINGTKITSETLDSTKLKDGSISGPDIAANTIRASNIAALTITASEIAASTITGAKIAAATIAAGNIVANTITASQIASGTITTTEIAANTITASDIAAATITGTQIAASTITATNLSVATLSAISANLGTVTAGNITGTDINIGSGAFHVTTAGALTATSADITGTFQTGSTGAYVKALSGNFFLYFDGDLELSLATGGGGGAIQGTNTLTITSLSGDVALNPAGSLKRGGNVVYDASMGYVTSAYGAKTAFSPRMYLWNADMTEEVEVFYRTQTVNGVTVTHVVLD